MVVVVVVLLGSLFTTLFTTVDSAPGDSNLAEDLRIQECVYCSYNAFSKVDMRVAMTIPGKTVAFAMDEDGNQLDTTVEMWKEAHVCSVLRALRVTTGISPRVLSCVVLSCPFLSFLVLSCLVLSYFILSYFILSCLVLSCLVLSCLVLSCYVLSYFILSCLVLSCLILPYLILSYFISSYLILSYLILSYFFLSYFILSYLILSCRDHPAAARHVRVPTSSVPCPGGLFSCPVH